ncbi:D-alanyl-D-alanine carboxypeptidase / D-alanyl-D-alanine-endopeptidase (penicillin-binding protein 4) [Soonwooa buanensis]|uniref:D-alanyl-D-alanine carboxypeptidase / D-alanyl-D-alanine-endopeptidase (Penicillin-binding protein 4) n=1 Tax=Soonwooa buanensis TaxID=619805 RepID=A0A1T5F5C0_9FLAO|nr:D-alanyl-D-alanine carboxypeptidase/D-alanyl-D-alanine-endopeptidase [Soonwooa buanensis]SKB91382.1 D-alanyl-D-alanine carboxypeptidase / D-alanyl-D-alanine-endopeptidase (penicillin-binding protein 4) [Soonwooa buanensis]
MNKFKKYISVLSLGFSISIFAQTSAVSSIPQFYEQPGLLAKEISPEKSLLSPKENIEVNINRMFSDPVLRTANWGFVVYDPKSNKIITSYNETTPLIPASTTKLLTTETAYSYFGGNFRWNTQLEFSGNIDENGVLDGNLYIIGSGDPSFGALRVGSTSASGLVSQFMNAIRDKGIKKVNGEIIVETGVFKENKTDLPSNIVWLDHNNYYLPVGTTRDINPRNEKFIVKQNNPFNNEKRYFYMSPYNNKMVYADKFEGGGLTTKLADPPTTLANSLRASMLKSGIAVRGKVTARFVDPTPEPREILSNYKSPMLSEIVHYTNQHSDNALSEALLKCLGFYVSGDQVAEAGKQVVRTHLEGKSFDTNGLNYVDGSGYSRSNLVTPIAQVKFLTGLMKEPYYKDYFESLPIAGQSGTLKKMFLTNSNGQIFAKTGTLSRVKTLAGYIKTRSGKTLVFSLLINNYTGSVAQVKDRMEQLLDPTLDL